ncbi:MAG TPA: transketolase family protein [Caldisericia bacterium]|nr:transketolase family protein [Caldisericia bacterium]
METKATRFGYSEALLKLGETDPSVVVLDADLSKSTTTNTFHQKFPNRAYNIGIAEQNMLGIAAGLSIAGKTPYVSTYGVFVSGRAYDQIRTTICYTNLNVKIGGAHGGISVGPDGATHQALEEIGLMRSLPNMTVIVPCDYHETYKATMASATIPGPVYIRFGREAIPIITSLETPFEFGKGAMLKEGNDVAIIACGSMVYESLVAAEELKKEGIHARVINIHTVKPIDEEIIIQAAQETGAIVTAEEHQIMAGFGSAVAEVIVQHHSVPMEMVGIEDTFGESGTPDELMVAYGLTHGAIIRKVKKVIQRK